MFTFDSPRRIAQSLKRSAEEQARKASPYQSAMSMLTFYMNRAGSKLPADRRAVLERAKGELGASSGGMRPALARCGYWSQRSM